MRNRKFHRPALAIAAWTAIALLAGCGGGSDAEGTAPVPGGDQLAAIQGEWVYVRYQEENPISGDCVTIDGDQVTRFVNNCKGDDLLLYSQDIVASGDSFELKFSLNLPFEGVEDAPILDVTATIVADGPRFVGEERSIMSAAAGQEAVFDIALQSRESYRQAE